MIAFYTVLHTVKLYRVLSFFLRSKHHDRYYSKSLVRCCCKRTVSSPVLSVEEKKKYFFYLPREIDIIFHSEKPIVHIHPFLYPLLRPFLRWAHKVLIALCIVSTTVLDKKHLWKLRAFLHLNTCAKMSWVETVFFSFLFFFPPLSRKLVPPA